MYALLPPKRLVRINAALFGSIANARNLLYCIFITYFWQSTLNYLVRTIVIGHFRYYSHWSTISVWDMKHVYGYAWRICIWAATVTNLLVSWVFIIFVFLLLFGTFLFSAVLELLTSRTFIYCFGSGGAARIVWSSTQK